MRILMLSQFYPPIIGGTERHVQNLSIELVKRGHDVAVVSLWHEGAPKEEVEQGVRLYRVRGIAQRLPFLYEETGRRHTPPFPDPGIVAALRTIIARERPEIVHAHNWLVHSFLPLKGWSRAKLVMTLHDFTLVCVQMRFMYRASLCTGPGFVKCLHCAANHYGTAKGIVTTLAHWSMSGLERNLVDMFLPVSHAVAAGTGLAQDGLPFEVIPNFVPDDGASPAEDTDTRLMQLPDNGYLLFVGDLTRDKGIDVLLEAYRGLCDAPPLVLIGRRCADTPQVFPNNVIVLHDWPHHSVLAAWRRSSVGFAPSLCPDACPTVVMEAMAAGKPVIGSQIGGITDLISSGESGLLVPAGEPEALRQAMSSLLAQPDLRERMGQTAKVRCLEFQASQVVSRIESVYQAVS